MRKSYGKAVLLRESEKTLIRRLTSVKNQLVVMKVKKGSLRWSQGSFDETIKELQKSVIEALKPAAKSF